MSLLNLSETPKRGKATPRKSLKLVLGIGVISGAFALSSTLAANIALNGGGNVEFGQGVAQTTACSDGESLIVTPLSSFTNAAGGGAFNFTGVTVSDIPASCEGVDFVISAYNTSGDALSIFNTSSTVASVWNNAGNFQAGTGTQGVEIESTDGTFFTINFTVPAALATNVARVTLQSTKHADYNCADDFIGCRVGDTGPGGGTIFYVNDSGFSVPGSACGNNCHNLEYAPSTWRWKQLRELYFVTGDQNMGQHYTWGGHTGTFLRTNRVEDGVKNGTGDQAIGAGFMNTYQMHNREPDQTIASPVRLYAGTNNSAGQWYIPSLWELKAIYESSAFASGNFFQETYTSSSENSDVFYYFFDVTNGNMSIENRNSPSLVRPIRAF
jgi:hypothetical protein